MSSHAQFITYYNDYKHKVYSFVLYRVGGDSALAEDITSATFLKAYEKFERYDDTYAFSTWIFTIARNTVTDHYRAHKGENIDIDEVQEIIEDERVDEADWQLAIDRELKLPEIYAALEKLPDNQKEVVILKYLEDHTTKEIAEIIDQSEGYVRLALSRGLKRLQPLLQNLKNLVILLFIPWL